MRGIQTAQDIEDTINRQPDFASSGMVATAKDANTVAVRIPESYRENPVLFASLILNLRMISPAKEARVVIDSRTGTVVVTDNVELGPVAVTHNNLTIETGDRLVSQFVEIDSNSDSATTQMQALLEALNALKVPSKDVIAIIRHIHRSGALYGQIVEVQ